MKTKTMVQMVSAAWLAAASFVAAASVEESGALPEPAWARVNLPYAELKALWEEEFRGLHPDEKPPPPPLPAVVRSAGYQLSLAEEAATLSGTYRVRAIAEDWQIVPLLGGEVRLLEGDAGEAEVIWRDGRYGLLVPGPGNYEATLRFAIPAPSTWTSTEGLTLDPAPATLTRLDVSGIPDRATIRVAELSPTQQSPGQAVFDLPGQGGPVQVGLEPYRAPTPSTWAVDSEALVHYREGRLVYQAHVYGRAEDGSGLTMDLWLPPSAQRVKSEGDDLADTRLGPRKDGYRLLHLRWRTRDILDRTVSVSYEVAQPPLSPRWTLSAPVGADSETTRCLFVVAATDGLELNAEGLVSATQARHIPSWMARILGATGFVTAESGPELAVRATWLPRMETAQAMIGTAAYRTRLVADGSLLVEAQFEIQHQAPLTWRLTLPPVDELLTCRVNDAPAQPVQRDNGLLEFSLPAPGTKPSRVSLRYATGLDALDPVSGRVALTLPQTDIFVHQLDWLLDLPEVYEATAVEGNVTINAAPTSGAAASSRTIRLQKSLVRGETPAAEIYYQRQDVGG